MIDTAIIDEASSQWLDLEGVEGIAEGKQDGNACILVMVSLDPAAFEDKIPSLFKGYPVVLEKTGEIHAQ